MMTLVGNMCLAPIEVSTGLLASLGYITTNWARAVPQICGLLFEVLHIR
jgi:hypothetical protein